jgi:Domain of unknown function (DUF4112)
MDTTTATNPAKLAKTQRQLDDLAWLMDNYFKIPGINWRFGLDSIIGLVPGAGDILAGIIAVFIVLRALQFKLPGIVIVRMILNTLLDVTVGAIPFIGDLFDLFFKANTRNMALFHKYSGEPATSTTAHWLFIGGLALGFFLVFAMVAAVTLYLIRLVLSPFIQ